LHSQDLGWQNSIGPRAPGVLPRSYNSNHR